LKIADDNARSARKLTYRMRLIQSNLIVDSRLDSAKPQKDKGQKQKKDRRQDEDSQQIPEDIEEIQDDEEIAGVEAN
jgi:hypothetical protein